MYTETQTKIILLAIDKINGENVNAELLNNIEKLASVFKITLKKTNKKFDFANELKTFVSNDKGYKDNLNNFYNAIK